MPSAMAAAMAELLAGRVEKIILTRWQQFQKDGLGSFYGMLLHEGQYFDPVMRDVEAFLDSSQEVVTGTVAVQLYKGKRPVFEHAGIHKDMEEAFQHRLVAGQHGVVEHRVPLAVALQQAAGVQMRVLQHLGEGQQRLEAAVDAREGAERVYDGLEALWDETFGFYALRLDDGARDARLDASTFVLVDAFREAKASR